MMTKLLNVVLVLFVVLHCALAASMDKPHSHGGVLEPYSGEPLPVQLTADQRVKLEKGEPVSYNERDGKSGFGVVIQDIDATGTVCFDKINDLRNYHKMVPHVKGVEIYEESTLSNGTALTSAKFKVGVMGMKIGYYLKLRHEPKHNTLSWTLDYRYSSDVDDSVGLWQVMPHPEKRDWTRILYSSKIKLLPFIPDFAIRSFTAQALTEATGWVKREAELEQKKLRARTTIATTGTSASAARSAVPETTCSTTSTDSADTPSSTAEKKSGGLSGWFKSLKGGNTDESMPVRSRGVWKHMPRSLGKSRF